jgi:fructose-1,6-bisphosphatase I
MTSATLDAFLHSHALHDDALRRDTIEIVRTLAAASIKVRNTLNQGAIGAGRSAPPKALNASGDAQTDLDVQADTIFLDAVRSAPVSLYASEELDMPVGIDPQARLAVSIDPLDGSSNIDTNASIGTIFSILPVLEGANPHQTFLQPGRRQLAAGFVIYGPQHALVLTLGSGTHVFVFSTRLGTFVQAHESRIIAPRAHEFAINASNYRHWHEPVRLYIDDVLKGSDGPRERDFNMRWNGSLVAEAYRILMRGGVFLYPADARKGRSRGHLRLVYEANPIAMLIEQAGGRSTDTVGDILDLVPEGLHQRTPLVFGASREVTRIGRYHTDPSMIGERAPLFGNRGLFRA